MANKPFTIASDSDGNIAFTVEAESAEAAALIALSDLGWSVKEPRRKNDDQDEDADGD